MSMKVLVEARVEVLVEVTEDLHGYAQSIVTVCTFKEPFWTKIKQNLE